MWSGVGYSPGYQGDSDVDTRRTEIHDLCHLKLVEKATLRFELPASRVSLLYPVPLWYLCQGNRTADRLLDHSPSHLRDDFDRGIGELFDVFRSGLVDSIGGVSAMFPRLQCSHADIQRVRTAEKNTGGSDHSLVIRGRRRAGCHPRCFQESFDFRRRECFSICEV